MEKSTVKTAKKRPFGYIFLCLVLIAALCIAFFEASQRSKEARRLALLERARQEEALVREEKRIELLRYLLTLPPCEAKTKWASQ